MAYRHVEAHYAKPIHHKRNDFSWHTPPSYYLTVHVYTPLTTNLGLKTQM